MSKLFLFLIVAGALFWWVSRRLRPPAAPTPSRSGAMSESEAREVLGLQASPSREDIIAAHRRLMHKVHPDHGGSGYLARQLNEAKRVLLDRQTPEK